MMRWAVLAVILLAGPAFAQSAPRAEPPRPERGAVPGPGSAQDIAPGPGPQERGSLDNAAVRARLLDDLYAKLKAAPESDAPSFDEAITSVLSRTGSASLDLLMSWANDDVRRNNHARALDYLDGLLVLDPTFAEAYYRRARLHYAQDDLSNALRDLERALALEPRHYHALTGLGAVLRDLDRPRDAYRAFRAALDLHPHLTNAQRALETLRPVVEGRDG